MFVVILLTVSLIVAGTSFLFYRDRTAGFKITVLEIDNEEAASMRYFLKRLSMSGEEPLAMFERLTREFIIKKTAPNPPYNIIISEDEITKYLRDTAKAETETISDNEFKEWYRQQIYETQLSDIELRDLIYRNLLAQRLSAYLADKVPTVAPQAFIHMIVLQSFNQAEEVKSKLDSGEDFFTLAQTFNMEENLRLRKGEIGWVPRNALEPGLANLAFNELELFQHSSPILINQQSFAILMVTERVKAREIDNSALQTIKARVLDQWYRDESKYHEIKFHGFSNGYDNETDAWISWQLEKMKK